MAATESAASSAISPAAVAAATNTISEEEVSALLEKSSIHGVKPYDFTAQRINRAAMPMLEVVAKSFADRMSAALSALLSRDAHVQFSAIDAAKTGEVQASLPAPSTLAVVRLKPLPGNAFVSLEPGILLTLLDGFFGGSGRATSDSQAAIAPAAQRFMALMLRSFMAEWTTAWSLVTPTPMEFDLVKQETNPRLMQLGAAQDSMVVLRFIVEFGTRSGAMDWLIPESMLDPIRDSLDSDAAKGPARKQEAWGPSLGSVLQDAELETRAILAQAQISLRELVRLTPGDVIPIETPQHVILLAGEVTLYHGRFGVSQGRNALKIISGGAA
jgi:flagellar motor switch protein FliM